MQDMQAPKARALIRNMQTSNMRASANMQASTIMHAFKIQPSTKIQPSKIQLSNIHAYY